MALREKWDIKVGVAYECAVNHNIAILNFCEFLHAFSLPFPFSAIIRDFSMKIAQYFIHLLIN